MINQKWQRIGKFRIPLEFLDNAPVAAINGLFKDMVIFKAEVEYCANAIDYVAYSPQFEEKEPNIITPAYKCHVGYAVDKAGARIDFTYSWIKNSFADTSWEYQVSYPVDIFESAYSLPEGEE